MNVSVAINGDLGRRIGRRKKDEERLEVERLAGTISLWHNHDLIVIQLFHSRAERSAIIEKWYSLYQLKIKRNVYFQILYA